MEQGIIVYIIIALAAAAALRYACRRLKPLGKGKGQGGEGGCEGCPLKGGCTRKPGNSGCR